MVSVNLRVATLLSALLGISATGGVGKLGHLRCNWVGEYPTTEGKFLLDVPEVKKKIIGLMGNEKFEELQTYSQTPINFVSGYYVIRFTTKATKGEDFGFKWVDVIIREYTGSIHLVTRFINNSKTDTQDKLDWKHSDETDLPPEILRMLEIPR
jgi:hypothetical protein